MKKNILHLITGLKAGGAETMLFNLVTNLDKNKFNNIICTLREGGEIEEKLKKNNFKVYSLGIKTKIGIFELPQASFKLLKILKKEKIDILNCWLIHACLLGRFAGKISGHKVVCSVQAKELLYKPLLFLDHLTSFLVDKYICVSNAVKTFTIGYVGIDSKKIEVIYNCIDDKPYQKMEKYTKKKFGLTNNTIIVGMVANLRKQKGHEYFLQAAKLIIEYGTSTIRFFIIGSGTEEKRLKELSKKLGIDEKVVFLGYRKDVPQLLSIVDIWASSTLYEGNSLALLEAMALKKPIVTTDIGENSEVVTNNKEAILVSPKDSHSLAAGIQKLIKNKELAHKLARNAQKRFKDFNLDTIIKKYEKMYLSMIK